MGQDTLPACRGFPRCRGVVVGVAGRAKRGRPPFSQRHSPQVHWPSCRPHCVDGRASYQSFGTGPPTSTPAGRCDLPSSDQQVPSVAPTGVTWQLWQGIALPFSKAAGPQVVQSEVARCYAHTPTGALLAAVQIQYRLAISDDWVPIVYQQVMPGPGRDALVALEKASAKTPEPPTPPGDYAQVAAFLFVTYTPHVAVIEIVTRSDSGAMGLETNTVNWSGGDWKLVLQPNGEVTPSVQTVTSTVGYVMWGGV